MKHLICSLSLFTLILIASCSKDDNTSTGYLEPIHLTSPTSNPSTIKLNQQFNLGATFTVANLIDSVMVSYQLDSNNIGYNASLTTPYITVKYPLPAKNVQSMDLPFIYKITSTKVTKMYLNIKLIAGSTIYNKQLTLDIL